MPMNTLYYFVIIILMLNISYTNASENNSTSNAETVNETGPNGGKLLKRGNVTLELSIFERGVQPEYRAWVKYNNKPVNNADIRVTLIRLGGKKDSFKLSYLNEYYQGDAIVKEPHSFDVSVKLKLKQKEYQWRFSSHEGRTKIPADMANKIGISADIAQSQEIERHANVFGRLITPPSQKAIIRARFPGVVQEVLVNVGEKVNKGDVLAIAESNQSLQTYPIKAPIDAIIQNRTINVGETTGGLPLFSLINNDYYWAELKIFPNQRHDVSINQSVHVLHNQHIHDSKISNITPSNNDAPYVLAHTIIDNSNMDMAPGDLISAQIDVEKVTVPLAVDNRALQTFRDWTVVFIQVGEIYEVRPLQLGKTDGRFSEVLSGLNPGDRYVVENSYLIKADIEKSGASHNH